MTTTNRSFSAVERVVDQAFVAQPFASVSIENAFGDVRVQSAEGDQVRIVARQVFPKAMNDAGADAAAKSLDFEIIQVGDAFVATARNVSPLSSGARAVRVDFDVTVPRSCILDVKTSGRGSVTLGNLIGAVRVRTASGNVEMGDIAGVVDVRTTDGNIKLAACTRLASLATQNGHIEAGPVGGNLEVSSLGGDITLGGVAGAIEANTHRGNIVARVTGVVTRDCVLSTSRGSIAMQTDATSALLLDAYANTGRVYSDDLPITVLAGGPGKSRFGGRINPGVVASNGKPGALVKMRTGGGDIDVRVARTSSVEPTAVVAENRTQNHPQNVVANNY